MEAIHALLLLLAAAAVVCRHKVCYHLKVVEAGRLYRSGELGRIGLWWVWRRYGVRTIVNLVTEYECRRTTACRREQRFCQKRGIEWVHLPILQGTVPDEEQIRRFVHMSLSDEHQPVLVHCKQGVGRTNLMVAIYRKERFGLPNEQILRELPLFGHMPDNPRYEKVREFVLHYQAAGIRRGKASRMQATSLRSSRRGCGRGLLARKVRSTGASIRRSGMLS